MYKDPFNLSFHPFSSEFSVYFSEGLEVRCNTEGSPIESYASASKTTSYILVILCLL